MRATFKVTGLRELEAALRALPEAIRRQPLHDALETGGTVLQAGMEARAPRDPVREGVTLAEEIVVNVVVATSRIWGTAEVGPSKAAFYGGFQEFGTRHHAAQPFMRPTLDEDGERAVAAFAWVMKDGVEDAARRLRSTPL